jgi:hypothetical protein
VLRTRVLQANEFEVLELCREGRKTSDCCRIGTDRHSIDIPAHLDYLWTTLTGFDNPGRLKTAPPPDQ